MPSPSWIQLNKQIVACELCPRLREHCSQVAREKRKAYRVWKYWGRPVPNFGDSRGRILFVGLAPAAHGANRTGRMFTGDRSGEFLYAGLHRAELANQARADSRDDGLQLVDCAITAAVHCAPPANKPTAEETANCRRWLAATFDQSNWRVFVALGQLGWNAVVREARMREWLVGGGATKFGHGVARALTGGRWLIGCYHPSQQNTFTGRLTPAMLDDVLSLAKHRAGLTSRDLAH